MSISSYLYIYIQCNPVYPAQSKEYISRPEAEVYTKKFNNERIDKESVQGYNYGIKYSNFIMINILSAELLRKCFYEGTVLCNQKIQKTAGLNPRKLLG